MIELHTEDSDTIHLQLEHCMKFYKTLSELKSQIEFVLKQGHSIVKKKQVNNTDALKLKYNELKFSRFEEDFFVVLFCRI